MSEKKHPSDSHVGHDADWNPAAKICSDNSGDSFLHYIDSCFAVDCLERLSTFGFFVHLSYIIT